MSVYDLTPEECTALAANAPGRWWVVLERTAYPTDDNPEYAPMPDLVFGPYPSEEAAEKATDSVLIDGECCDTKKGYNLDECRWTDTREEDAEVVLVDLTDWHHTGEPDPDEDEGGPGIYIMACGVSVGGDASPTDR